MTNEITQDMVNETIDNEYQREMILNQTNGMYIPFTKEQLDKIKTKALNLQYPIIRPNKVYPLPFSVYDNIVNQLINYANNTNGEGKLINLISTNNQTDYDEAFIRENIKNGNIKSNNNLIWDTFHGFISYIITNRPVDIPVFIDLPPIIMSNTIYFYIVENHQCHFKEGKPVRTSSSYIDFVLLNEEITVDTNIDSIEKEDLLNIIRISFEQTDEVLPYL